MFVVGFSVGVWVVILRVGGLFGYWLFWWLCVFCLGVFLLVFGFLFVV